MQDKLIIGFIFKTEPQYKKAKAALIKHFCDIDYESDTLEFNLTDYYEPEFGQNLNRKFISFKKVISPGKLARIKTLTNRLEKKFSKGGKRAVNIDPGYLNLSKLVLASTKDYAHRIYLDKGIYAEITLIFRNKTFGPWEWTYPDFRTAEYIAIFNQIRQIYTEQIKCGHHI